MGVMEVEGCKVIQILSPLSPLHCTSIILHTELLGIRFSSIDLNECEKDCAKFLCRTSSALMFNHLVFYLIDKFVNIFDLRKGVGS